METTKSRIIEVNGIQYDASTGAKIATGGKAASAAGRNIDGFFRSRTSGSLRPTVAQVKAAQAAQARRQANHLKHHAPQASHSVAVRAVAAPKKLQSVPVRHRAAPVNHVHHHAIQTSATLMRKAVKKPAPSFYKQAATKGSLQHAVPSLIAVKSSVANVDIGRLTRAKSVSRSPQITHHASSGNQNLAPHFVPLAVKPVPAKPGADAPHTAPAPAPNNKPTPTDIFEHALANASHYVDVKAHSHSFKKKTRNHVLSMAAGTLALLIIAGFAAYQNTPGLQFKVASMQAGVSTHMPNLKAAGFAYDGVKSGDGKLTVGFNGNNGSYKLTQQPTNWTSDDMIQHVGATDATGRPVYRTVSSSGATVYRFSNTDATWVQNGTWYSLSGTSNLTDQQVSKLIQNI